MLLTLYAMAMGFATVLVAVHCWVVGIALVVIGLGISWWCWRKEHYRWDGVERRREGRRSTDRVARVT